MTYNSAISTVVLLMLLSATIPAFAQKGEEKKGGGDSPQRQHEAQPQHAQQSQHQAQAKHEQQSQHREQPQHQQQAQHQSQPQHTQHAEPQHARPEQAQRAQHQEQQPRRQQQTDAYNRGNNGGHGNNGNHYGRISNANYNSHFGHDHHFHMGRPQMIGGYNRFQYGGYSFGYNESWPVGWGYDDDCYVVYEDGAYYMYNLRHPGFHISLSIF